MMRLRLDGLNPAISNCRIFWSCYQICSSMNLFSLVCFAVFRMCCVRGRNIVRKSVLLVPLQLDSLDSCANWQQYFEITIFFQQSSSLEAVENKELADRYFSSLFHSMWSLFMYATLLDGPANVYLASGLHQIISLDTITDAFFWQFSDYICFGLTKKIQTISTPSGQATWQLRKKQHTIPTYWDE